MCGICGKYNYAGAEPVTRAELKKMNDLLVHRGPDDEGYYEDGNVGLAMRRLSIIDLSTGHQPISNEDGTVWIVFNGEIYNFPELHDRLLRQGHVFRTKSDTETIIHLYEELGTGFVKELRGMFAIAIWDGRKKRLVLARDRVGKKPLFYSDNGSFLAFASELSALLAAGVSREIDLRAVDAFLTLQYIPSPLSIFKSVKKLEPASVLTLENGKIAIEKYWEPPVGAEKLDLPLPEVKERLYDALLEATRIRLMSEVPVGAFLSGGIDSSVVVALMARSSPEPVKTFAIGFKEAEFSELGYARQVAELYGTRHTEFIVESKMTEVLGTLVRHYGEPFADASALPSYFVSRETRRAVTVALNGDGGDEDFGGYMRYVVMKLDASLRALPGGVKKALGGLAGLLPQKPPYGLPGRAGRFLAASLRRDPAQRYLAAVSYFGPEEKQGLFTTAYQRALGEEMGYGERRITGLFNAPAGVDLMSRLAAVDFGSFLPDCLMTKMDIASMANSLETRSPFLDQKVIEFACRLPGELKLRGVNGTKWILKETFKDLLPARIYKRGKMGFGIPLGPWFRGELKDYWAGTCLSDKALGRGYFNRDFLVRLWDEHQSGARDHGYRLWVLLMLELWHKEFADDFKL